MFKLGWKLLRRFKKSLKVYLYLLSRWKICHLYIWTTTDTFESFVTKKVYQINHSFNCDSKCLIYLFSCKFCGIQYVGSTVGSFQLRWNNCKSYQRNAADEGTPNQNYFHRHFLSEGHNSLMNDCEIILINKMDSSDPTRREFFLDEST